MNSSDLQIVDDMNLTLNGSFERRVTDRVLDSALKFLLSVACLRTAPKHISEIAGGSNNQQMGNVCYINPDDLPPVGLPAHTGVRFLSYVPGALSLVVATPLIPKGGVIYAPLNQAVLDLFGLDAETYRRQGFNVSREGGLIINASSPARVPVPHKALGDGKVIDAE